MKKYLLLTFSGLLLASAIHGQEPLRTVQIHLDRYNSDEGESGNYFNGVSIQGSALANTERRTDLKDKDGQQTGWNFYLITPSWNAGTEELHTGVEQFPYPENIVRHVAKENSFSHNGPAEFYIGNLHPDRSYRLSFYGYLNVEDEVYTEFTVQGMSQNLRVDKNINNTIAFNAIEPDENNRLNISFGKASGEDHYYSAANLIIIEEFGPVGQDQPPVASDISFSGSLKANETITANFTYFDEEQHPPGNHHYKFIVADDATGSNPTVFQEGPASQFILHNAHIGKFIDIEVTPYAQSGMSPGNAVRMGFSGPVEPAALQASKTVQIHLDRYNSDEGDPGSYFNGVAIHSAAASANTEMRADLKDIENQSTGWSFVVVNPSWNAGTVELHTGAENFPYPEWIVRRVSTENSYNSNGPAEFYIGNLNPERKYRISCYGYLNADEEVLTEFTVQGNNQILRVDKNIDKTVVFYEITPDENNRINISFAKVPGGDHYYTAANVITVEELQVSPSASGITGTLTRELWENIPGKPISDLTSHAAFPENPDQTGEISLFDAPANAGSYYGQRIYGYIIPPETGEYTFWIASDDRSELFLSTDSNPENKRLISFVSGSTPYQSWDHSADQASDPILLTAGIHYYIEALHKEDAGYDHVSVAWSGPGISREVIGSDYLSSTPGPPITSVTGIALSPNAIALEVNESAQLIATVAPGNATDPSIFWETDNPLVATVDPSGNVTAIAPGMANITVTTNDGGFAASCEITVGGVITGTLTREFWENIPGKKISDLTSDAAFPQNPDETAGISIFDAPRNIGSYYGQKIYGYIIPPVTGEYTFWIASDDRSELYLSTDAAPENKSLISFVSGSTPYQGWDHNADQASDPIMLTAGGYYYIEALHKEDGGYDHISVAWSGPGFGREIIGSDYISTTATASVPVTGVSISQTSINIFTNQSTPLTATIAPVNATNQAISWNSSNPSVATVDQNGNVSGVAPGTANITVTTADGGFAASCQVTVNHQSGPGGGGDVTWVSLNHEILNMLEDETLTLIAQVTPADADDPTLSWSTSDPSVLAVDQNGIVTATGEGAATITVTTNDRGFTAQCQISVYAFTPPKALTHTPQYNGNISAIKWSAADGAGESREKVYAYDYDNLNRIKNAYYAEKATTGNWTQKAGGFNVEDIGYDLNGNIRKLRRYHYNTNVKLLDQLSYDYDPASPNRLTSVTDQGGNRDQGFKDKYIGDLADYAYDANGNLIADRNKNIEDIEYNHLNLPKVIHFTGSREIRYIYDAAGIKLKKEVYEGAALISATHYINGVEYKTVRNEASGTTDTYLDFIHTEEGRALPKIDGTYRYEYFLKDHLGNVRATIASESETIGFTATLEDPQADEAEGFRNIDSRHQDQANNHTPGGSYAAYLNAAEGKGLGPAIMLKVNAGDTVDAEVYGRFIPKTNDNTYTAANIFALLTSAFGYTAGPPEMQLPYNAIENAFGAMGTLAPYNSNTPAAYLNYIFIDQNFQDPEFGYEPLTESAAAPGYQKLTKEIAIEKSGFVYIYVANESQYDYKVFFDDLKVSVTKSKIAPGTDYYPFGMMIAESSGDVGDPGVNKYLYNGKELQNELGLDWYDYGARMYDGTVSRWMVIDKLAEKYSSSSIYNYTLNNPIVNIDPDGQYTFSITKNKYNKIILKGYRIRVQDAKFQDQLASVPIIGTAGYAVKLLYTTTDPSYKFSAADYSFASLSILTGGSGSFANKFLRNTMEKGYKLGQGILWTNREGIGQLSRFLENDYTELYLDEATFKIAEKLGMGRAGIGQADRILIFSDQYINFIKKQILLSADDVLSSKELKAEILKKVKKDMDIIKEKVRTAAFDFDLNTPEGIEGLSNVINLIFNFVDNE